MLNHSQSTVTHPAQLKLLSIVHACMHPTVAVGAGVYLHKCSIIPGPGLVLSICEAIAVVVTRQGLLDLQCLGVHNMDCLQHAKPYCQQPMSLKGTGGACSKPCLAFIGGDRSPCPRKHRRHRAAALSRRLRHLCVTKHPVSLQEGRAALRAIVEQQWPYRPFLQICAVSSLCQNHLRTVSDCSDSADAGEACYGQHVHHRGRHHHYRCHGTFDIEIVKRWPVTL